MRLHSLTLYERNTATDRIAGFANFVRRRIGRIGQQLRCRAAEWELSELDDRTLRDIGLTRSQVHAAAYGLLRLGGASREEPAREPKQACEQVGSTIGGAPATAPRRRCSPCYRLAAALVAPAVLATSPAAGDAFAHLPRVADLPAGTVKVSPPVPGMGEHWANPTTLKWSLAVAASLFPAGAGGAHADWLDSAWNEDWAGRHGHPSISMSSGARHVVLPAVLLQQVYDESLTTVQALGAFLDRFGQRCSGLIDLNAPHRDLKVTLSLKTPASLQQLTEEDRDTLRTAWEAAYPSDRTEEHIPLLFAVSPVSFGYGIDDLPTRRIRCVAPGDDEPTS